MSRIAKIAWLFAAISIVTLVATRYIIGGWIDYLYVPLVIFIFSFVAAIVVDFKFYFEFLTMRTTKHGMNMGVMILLGLVGIIAINFLGVRHNKVWDLTEERLNSLAEQSEEIITGLDSDSEILVFYRGEKDRLQKQQIENILSMYGQASSRVKIRYINSYVDNAMSQKYLADLADKDSMIVFVEYNGKRVRAAEPFGEEQITSAIVKATRKENKKIYFLSGHGEKSLDSTEPTGLSDLKKALEDSAFAVDKLSLLEGQVIPADAAVLAIVGPVNNLFPAEIKMINDWVAAGGRVLLALDPGQKHDLNQISQLAGVEFNNEFVLNDMVQLQGVGMAGALGLIFDGQSEITRSFRTGENFVLFDLSSNLKQMDKVPEGVSLQELVKTPPNSFAVQDVANIDRRRVKRSSYTLAMSAKGKLNPSENEFAMVVVGDSDFLSNRVLGQGLNRDFALNSIAFLAAEKDLISIRPKAPSGTKLNLTSAKKGIMVVSAVALPLILLSLSGILWFRRRGA